MKQNWVHAKNSSPRAPSSRCSAAHPCACPRGRPRGGLPTNSSISLEDAPVPNASGSSDVVVKTWPSARDLREARHPQAGGQRARQRRMRQVRVPGAQDALHPRRTPLECQLTVAQSTSHTTTRPPGRSARCICASAAVGSATYSSTWTQSAASKLSPLGHGQRGRVARVRNDAFAWRAQRSAPRPRASRRARVEAHPRRPRDRPRRAAPRRRSPDRSRCRGSARPRARPAPRARAPAAGARRACDTASPSAGRGCRRRPVGSSSSDAALRRTGSGQYRLRLVCGGRSRLGYFARSSGVI